MIVRRTILMFLLGACIPLFLDLSKCHASSWECINRNGFIPTCNTWRWPVPHGWLVSVDNNEM